MAEHDPAGVAKEAAARQAVELAGAVRMIAVAVAFQIAQRQAGEPDFIPQLSARAKLWRRRLARRAEGRLARLGIWALAQAERQRAVADGH
jgi:hypothetical protein